MLSATPLVPDQIVDCVSTGRMPTAADLDSVASRMWSEGAAHRSAFSWGQVAPAAADRVGALRSAVMALQGSSLG